MLLAQLNNNYIQKKQKLIQFLRKMIQKVTMYQAVCDGCGLKLRHPHWGLVLLPTSSYDMFESRLKNEAWREIDGKLYCPGCVEWDEETCDYKPKK